MGAGGMGSRLTSLVLAPSGDSVGAAIPGKFNLRLAEMSWRICIAGIVGRKCGA